MQADRTCLQVCFCTAVRGDVWRFDYGYVEGHVKRHRAVASSRGPTGAGRVASAPILFWLPAFPGMIPLVRRVDDNNRRGGLSS